MKKISTALIALAAMATMAGALEITITHSISDEVFLRENQPNSNQGSTRVLFGGQSSGEQFVFLMKFTLPPIEKGTIISSVQLDLGPAMTSGSGTVPEFTGDLYQYTDFNSATATWYNPDGKAGDSTAGGSYSANTLLAQETFNIVEISPATHVFSSTPALVNYLQTAYDKGDTAVYFRLSNDSFNTPNSFLRTDDGDVRGTGQATLNLSYEAFIPSTPPEWQEDSILDSAYAEQFYRGSLAGKAIDPNHDSITYYLVSEPTWLTVTTNGILFGTPTLAHLGTNTFTVAATDGNSGTNEAILNVIVSPTPTNPTLLVEAESFSEKGGWVVDQQFMQAMGSPYLLAHGMGKPVADAITTVIFPVPGTYKMWVRTKNWVPGAWEAPGRFEVLINGTAVETTFGTLPDWTWQDGGTIDVTDTHVQISLHDLTGFEGRCDALYFDSNPSVIPPEFDMEYPQLDRQWRNALLGLPVTPPDGETFDVVIVGAGVAGCAAALAAEKSGLSVALVNDREILGGAASGEIRVGTRGIYGPSGDIISLVDNWYPGNGNPIALIDDIKRENAMLAAAGITILRPYRAYDVQMDGSKIISVDICSTLTGEAQRIYSDIFIDCTGDGWIGYWAGADYRYGRESRDEFDEKVPAWGELWSPKEPDNRVMGASVIWYSKNTGQSSTFPAVPWALDVANGHSAVKGEWQWEYSNNDLHQVDDAEQIRDHLFRAIYGSFSNAKESGNHPNDELDWVGYLSGKRESRRLMGDYIYTMSDMGESRTFRDTVVEEIRECDVHYQLVVQGGTKDFLSQALYYRVSKYYVPFRTLYSRNIENLMMAGRSFSCSHIGLGGPRVQKTTGQMGVAVGYAAALCKQYNINPRDIYKNSDRMRDLQNLLGGAWPQQPLKPDVGLAVIMDDNDAGMKFVGAWTASSYDKGYYGTGYRHDGNAAKGSKWATFSATAPTNGVFQVELFWVDGSNRASNVPVWVQTNKENPEGPAHFIVDQSIGGSQWNTLKEVSLQSGDTVYVIIGTAGTDAFVMADAMRLYLPDSTVVYLDSDNDGMPDFWEEWYFGSVTAGDPDEDSDGDGLSNLKEYRAGTDPLSPDSVFSTNLNRTVGSDYTLRWSSAKGKSYRIESADDIDGTFVSMAENIIATPPENTYTVSLDANYRFYRVVVEGP